MIQVANCPKTQRTNLLKGNNIKRLAVHMNPPALSNSDRFPRPIQPPPPLPVTSGRQQKLEIYALAGGKTPEWINLCPLKVTKKPPAAANVLT